jgi:protein involved in polysaccharide export with SLBB domain
MLSSNVRADDLNNNVSESFQNSEQQSNNNRSPFTPGDAVEINTFPDTTAFINKIFPITDLGYVDLPIYGKVKITEMTKSEFENFLREKYRDYLRYPNVQVKPLVRVSVLGGVPIPGFYYYDADFSLWELINKAGGTIHEEGLKDMKWDRDREAMKDNLIPYLQNGTSLKNMGFRSGDQIRVQTPGQPGWIQRTAQVIVPVLTFAISMYSFYLSYYILLENRRQGVNTGAGGRGL